MLGISRLTVRKVLRSKSPEVPALPRPEKAEPYRQQILELLRSCKGNLVRVHEELVAGGAKLSYQALTAFCRRHGIGQEPPKLAVGQLRLQAGRGNAARHLSARGRTRGEETQGADRVGRAVLLADAVLSVLPDVSAFRLQGLSHRSAALLRRRTRSAS